MIHGKIWKNNGKIIWNVSEMNRGFSWENNLHQHLLGILGNLTTKFQNVASLLRSGPFFTADHPIGLSKFSAIQLDLKVMARLTLNVGSMFLSKGCKRIQT